MTMEMLLRMVVSTQLVSKSWLRKTVKRLIIRSVNMVRQQPMKIGAPNLQSRLDEDYGTFAVPYFLWTKCLASFD